MVSIFASTCMFLPPEINRGACNVLGLCKDMEICITEYAISITYEMLMLLGSCLAENCIVFGSTLISTCAHEVTAATEFFNVTADDGAAIANLKITDSQVTFDLRYAFAMEGTDLFL